MMSHHSGCPRPSLPKQFVNFANRTGGLDYALRLIQALAIVAAELYHDNDFSVKCLTASAQLSFVRRFLRLHSFIEFFQHAYDLLAGDSPYLGSMSMMIELGKSTFLGLYLFMENFTIVFSIFSCIFCLFEAIEPMLTLNRKLHDMNIWPVSWNTSLLIEANKFWFYAICLSITGTLLEWFYGSSAGSKTQNRRPEPGEKKKQSEESTASEQVSSPVPFWERLVIDICDSSLPGSFVGWIPLSDLGVGLAMIVSSLVASRDVWVKAQQ